MLPAPMKPILLHMLRSSCEEKNRTPSAGAREHCVRMHALRECLRTSERTSERAAPAHTCNALARMRKCTHAVRARQAHAHAPTAGSAGCDSAERAERAPADARQHPCAQENRARVCTVNTHTGSAPRERGAQHTHVTRHGASRRRAGWGRVSSTCLRSVSFRYCLLPDSKPS